MRSIGVAAITAVMVTAATLAGATPAGAALTGETLLASGPPGTGPLPAPLGGITGRDPFEDQSDVIAVSADGRYVAFTSDADGLSAENDDRFAAVYRKDRVAGAVVLVSRADGANGAALNADSGQPAMSDDGSRITFTSGATNAAPGDATPSTDVFVRDLGAGTTVLVSVGAATDADAGALSGDGQYVAFATEAALDGASDTNGVSDVYRRRLATGTTELISRADTAGGAVGDFFSAEPAISENGDRVAFTSSATHLDLAIGAEPGPDADVFVRFVGSAATELVSAQNGTSGGGAVPGNGSSNEPAISDDGVFVAFTSTATNLNGGDTDSSYDVLRRTVGGAVTALMSISSGGVKQNDRANSPAINADGSRVEFASDATNLELAAGPGPYYNTYVRTPTASSLKLLSPGTAYSVRAALSDAGTVAAFESATTLTADDASEGGTYARTVPLGAPPPGPIEFVSRPAGAAPFPIVMRGVRSLGGEEQMISGDGRYAVFSSRATELSAENDDAYDTVYRRDLLTGEVVLVSRATGAAGAAASGNSATPSVSADGTRVAFVSTATNLDPADATPDLDVYVRDIPAGKTTLASRADGAGGAKADAPSVRAVIAPGGGRVAFASAATNLGAPGGIAHIWVRDLAAGTTLLADRQDGPGGAPSPVGVAAVFSITPDGTRVAFATSAQLAGDADALTDVFVRDLAAGTTRHASVSSAGVNSDGAATNPDLDDDGGRVAFDTMATNLAGIPVPAGVRQVYVRDLAAVTTTLVSRSGAGGAPGDDQSRDPSLSGDGTVVAFETEASNLGVTLAGAGAVIARRTSDGVVLGARAAQPAGLNIGGVTDDPALSADGQCLAYRSWGGAPVAGVSPDFQQLYVLVLAGGVCPKPLPQPATPTAQPAGSSPAVLRITRASLTNRRFRVSTRATALSAARRTPAGTIVRFTLSDVATVRITIARRTSGRRTGRRCVAPTRKLRRARRCTRYATTAALTRRNLARGARRVAFSGRVGRRALKPGSYRATLTARAADGRTARPVALTFTVVRR